MAKCTITISDIEENGRFTGLDVSPDFEYLQTKPLDKWTPAEKFAYTVLTRSVQQGHILANETDGEVVWPINDPDKND